MVHNESMWMWTKTMNMHVKAYSGTEESYKKPFYQLQHWFAIFIWFTGLDADTAYIKNDYKHLSGDKDLWRQVKLSKSMLGYCTPLALETNGMPYNQLNT